MGYYGKEGERVTDWDRSGIERDGRKKQWRIWGNVLEAIDSINVGL